MNLYLLAISIYIIIVIIISLEYHFGSYRIVSQTYHNKYKLSQLKLLLNLDYQYSTNNQYNVIFFYSHNYKVIPDYFDKGYQILSTYCNKHKYKLLIMDHTNDTELVSPYWLRVKDFILLSQIYPKENNLFIYLDLDTCLNPNYMNLPIDNLINKIDYINGKSWDMYVGNEYITIMNAGGIIVKNTLWSRQLLQLWWSKYNNSNWVLNNNKWFCYNKSGFECAWARDGYEQGELINIYNNNELDTQNHLLILNNSIISNNSLYFDSFIYHFFGIKNRDQYYKPLYDKFLLNL